MTSSDLKNVAEVQAVSDGNFELSVDLHNVLREVHQNNLIFSPFSVSAVTAMVKLGARGVTSDEMVKGFKFPAENETLSKGYLQILSSFQEDTNGYTLSAANNVYVQDGFGIKAEYSEALKNFFNVNIQQLNFGKNVEAAAEINSWVEKTTRNKITNLISPDALNSLTRLVLVNGVYFKGSWAKKFDSQNTEQVPFYLNENETIDVSMMYQEAKFPISFFPELDASVLSLPYEGDRLTMLIYLPQSKQHLTGLSKIEENLKEFPPSRIISQLTTETVQVHLPRFKIESTITLVNPLKKLGLESMFNDSADFSGIPEVSNQLHISEIVQKAFIEVNEEGAEAAAATAVMMMLRCMPMTTEFRCDHSFFFQIVDTHTNMVVFNGKCTNPNNNN